MNDSFAKHSTRAPRNASNAGSHRRRAGPAGTFLWTAGLALTALLGACDRKSTPGASSNPPGTVMLNPATNKQFVVDPNFSGQANRLSLQNVFWGRLVDVFDVNNTLLFEDFVIGDNIASDLVHYRLDRNPITETETLTILHPVGTPLFNAKFADLDRNVQPVKKNGLSVLPTSTLTAMPRNAALVMVFDDLLDSSEITAKNVVLVTGYPPILPFEARVIPDPSHGDLYDSNGDGTPEFHTTRVLIDMTVSELEATNVNPPLPVNSLGLPEAQVIDQPNVLVRMPTSPAPAIGQLSTLTNLGGAGMDFAANGPNDPQSVTRDVVRSLRSSSADLLDPNNGFLVDQIAPRVIGSQGIRLTGVTPTGLGTFLIDADFDFDNCTPTPRIGDVIRLADNQLMVNHLGGTASGGAINDVPVVLVGGSSSVFQPNTQALYLTPFDPTMSLDASCFVRFAPAPDPFLFPTPNAGIQPNTSITIRFSEPMDPGSVSAFENFTITRLPAANGGNALTTNPLGNTICGTVQPSLDLKEFTYTPQIPLERSPGLFPQGENYGVTLKGGTSGAIDLAGKGLSDALPAFSFRIDPAATTQNSRCFVLKFNGADEDGNGAPELRGQFLFNLTKGTIRPRSVARFSAVADATQPVLGLQTPFPQPIQTPLSNLGSKMMTVYRYHDLGFGVVDDSTLNLDIEALCWAPFLGLQVDSYSRFRMAFCHSKFLPDEIINPMSLLPSFPNSGLVKTFDQNILDPAVDPLKIMHAKDLGYDVQPVNAFVASTGTLMMPYPLNRGLTKTQMTRYTWRDTSILAVGGPNGSGVETNINAQALGITAIKHYPTGKVPTIGLPLLMEFRCYPDDLAFGLNGFKINIALTSSARPAFRAFSTGGVLSNGSLLKIDPDNEPIAKAGINPVTGTPTGFGTELDPVVYLGQADFVVRVNRIHTIWLDVGQFGVQCVAPIVEPPSTQQPLGTSVVVALRGSTNLVAGTIPPGGVAPVKNANAYDAYGDPKATVVVPGNFTVNFPLLGGVPDNTWKTNMSVLNAAPQLRNIQARITMISNPDTLLFPELSGMGFSARF